MLVHSDVIDTLVVAFFIFKWQIDWYADRDLVFFPKGIEVFFLNGGPEVIHCPQRKKNELSKAIRTYDGLGREFSTDYVLSFESPSDPSTSTSSSPSAEDELEDGTHSS